MKFWRSADKSSKGSRVKGIKRWTLLSLFLFIPLSLTTPVSAQESFYKGKTIRIIVGTSPGGGYDTYTRLIARHIGRYIPGSPAIVVENMPGAGSLISANHLYKAAKPDGLTVGHFIGAQFMQQLLGNPGVEFDALKFEYIGVPAQDHMVIGLAKATGITTMEQWFASKTPIKLGGIAPGDGTYDIPKILEATLSLPVQMVSGYRGTAPIRLAFNSGEVAGLANSWESFKATWRKELDSGDVIIMLQGVPKAHPDLPRVPLAISFAKTDEARKLIQVGVHSYGPTARPYVLPPGTPKERVQILRKALIDTMRDSEFLGEAKKAKLDINPGAGEELERNVKEIFKLEPGLLARLKEILK